MVSLDPGSLTSSRQRYSSESLLYFFWNRSLALLTSLNDLLLDILLVTLMQCLTTFMSMLSLSLISRTTWVTYWARWRLIIKFLSLWLSVFTILLLSGCSYCGFPCSRLYSYCRFESILWSNEAIGPGVYVGGLLLKQMWSYSGWLSLFLVSYGSFEYFIGVFD